MKLVIDWGKLAGFGLCTMFYAALTLAQQVPKDLPGEKALEAYLKYQKKPAYSAFAIAHSGAWGAAWSYGLIAEAEKAAIEDCRQRGATTPCLIVSIDGQSLQETIQVEDLQVHLHTQSKRQWPLPEQGQVPIQIARNEAQIRAYRGYLSDHGHKAFAASREGAYGYASGHVNRVQAEQAAVQNCQQHDIEQAGTCSLVDVNHQALLGRIKVAHQFRQAELDKLPSPMPSDSETQQQAKLLFGSRWDEYKQAKRHKAYAANQFGASGLAKDHVNALVAEEAALGACEAFNRLRRGNTRLAHKVAPCRLVASNDYFDLDALQVLGGQ